MFQVDFFYMYMSLVVNRSIHRKKFNKWHFYNLISSPVAAITKLDSERETSPAPKSQDVSLGNISNIFIFNYAK